MKSAIAKNVWALLILLLCFHTVVAHVARPVPRQDDGGVTTSIDRTESTTASATTGTSAGTTTTMSSSIVSSTASTTDSVMSSSVSATSTSSTNSSMFNSTIADGELPYTPKVTPGWGVAGAILIITGAAYALVGIRTRWLYCFFSVAFLAAVSVTVLIMYVMSPPISNAVQGAYVVAAVCTGVILGGIGLIFRDVLECLGCLLGGFCLSMWLLTLQAGGLTGSGGAGTVIFICVFSGAGLAGYFSRWTRPQYMIVCIALNGATATVIGIDCFSRAGLKEFWAWIWDLNDNIFPYDAETYPLTRGIRVEQAITIILMLGGIISQSRLWNLIKERRARREDERRKQQEAAEAANMNAGEEIERINARERQHWEAVHGDVKSPMSVHTNTDSGVGDMDSEQKSRHSGTVTTTTRRSLADDVGEIEMAELPVELPVTKEEEYEDDQRPSEPPKVKSAAELVMGKSEKDGIVTVRVAVDEVEATAGDEPQVDVHGKTKESQSVEAQRDLKVSTQQAQSGPSTPVPEVVPLPFKVPQAETEEHEGSNRSSFATFADVEDELPARRRSVDSKRSSFAKRLSTGSTNLLRRLSQNSLAKHLEAAQGPNESQEELVPSVRGDRDSVAATFDEESSLGEDEARSRLEEGSLNMEDKDQQEDEADAAAHKSTEKDEDSKQGKSVVSETDSKPASLSKDRLPRALSKIALSYRTNEWAKHLSHAEMPAPEELQILPPNGPRIAEVNEAAAPVNVNDLQKTAENAALPPAMPRTVSVMSARQLKNQSRVSFTQGPSKLAVPVNGSPPLSPSLEPTGGQPSSKRSSVRTVNAITEEMDGGESRISSESRRAAVRAAAAALTGEATPGTSSADLALPGNTAIHSRPPVPGVISYNSPQSLIAKRDMLLRAKNQALNRPESNLRGLVNSTIQGQQQQQQQQQHKAPAAAVVDLDDIPLNQRKSYIKNDRRSSMSSMNSNRPSPGETVAGSSRRSSFVAQRRADLPSQVAARESQQFVQSPSQPQQQKFPPQAAAAGMRASSSSFLPPTGRGAGAGAGAGVAAAAGHTPGGPLINQVYGIPGTSTSNSLLPHQTPGVWDAEVSRDIDVQRQFLMNQKEIDARKRESARAQRESVGRRVERRMRTDSQMMEAHREALRKMQRVASRQA